MRKQRQTIAQQREAKLSEIIRKKDFANIRQIENWVSTDCFLELMRDGIPCDEALDLSKVCFTESELLKLLD